MSSTTATKARQNFFDLIEKAARPGHAEFITIDGEPKVVLMSSEEYEGWQETLEIMSDKNFTKQLEKGLEDVKRGAVIPWNPARYRKSK